MSSRPFPIEAHVVKRRIQEMGLEAMGSASIREIKRIADLLEIDTGVPFIRMEMGIPGLPALQVGVDAQIRALEEGVAAIYPDIQGIPSLKSEMARFVKLFMDVEVRPEHCVPTVGSMMGGMVAFMVINRMWANREGTLYLDPGFPVQKAQCKILGHTSMSFDIYEYRGEKLQEKLESILETGKVSSILYSSPNNPSWICFTEEELKIIGELATQYNVVVIEDLAYFAMDFRKDYSVPGRAPFQPTVARYTDNYILLISSSKAFSYAGERIGMMVVSDKVWKMRSEDLRRFFSSNQVGHCLVYEAVYSLSAGTSHSAQHAMSAILKAVNDGDVNFVDGIKEYGEKAKIMKQLFVENGFSIVYDKDLQEPIADGFYFTFSYAGMDGGVLLEELMRYGISAITLGITGSIHKEGLRACTSLVKREQFPELEKRLKAFHEAHKK